MLYLIISSIIYFIVSCGFGKLMDPLMNKNQLLSIRLINGLFSIGILSLIFAIFIPLNIYYEVILLTIGITLFILQKGWKSSWERGKSFLIIFATICLVGSMNAFMFDTYSYYLPTIKWLDQYGLVKGIANFDFNLGQHSLWHIIQASFNASIDGYYKINVFLMIIYILYVIEIKRFQLLLLLPIFFLFTASPSPDLAVFVLSILMISQVLISHKYSLHQNLIYSAILILIKPIAFVLPVYIFIISIKQWKSYKKAYGIVLVLALLFLFKNIYLTANLIFPLKIGNINSLTHSIPESIYDISAIDGRLVTLKHVRDINMEWFKTLSLKEYYMYLFENMHYSIFLFLAFSCLMIIYFIHQFMTHGSMKLLSLLWVLKVILFALITVQYRFLLDGIVILGVLFLWNFKIQLKVIQPFIVISAFILILYPNLNHNKVSYARLMQPYAFEQLLKPQKMDVKYQNVTLFHAPYRVILNYDVSCDVDPLNINKMLIDRYVYQGYHAENINHHEIKSGFKAVKNSNRDIFDLTKYYYMIYYSRKIK